MRQGNVDAVESPIRGQQKRTQSDVGWGVVIVNAHGRSQDSGPETTRH